MINNLKRCREELEMTQGELGLIFGVTKNTVSGWENGHNDILLKKLIKFSNLYKFSLDFIIDLKKSNNNYREVKKQTKNKLVKTLKL